MASPCRHGSNDVWCETCCGEREIKSLRAQLEEAKAKCENQRSRLDKLERKYATMKGGFKSEIDGWRRCNEELEEKEEYLLKHSTHLRSCLNDAESRLSKIHTLIAGRSLADLESYVPSEIERLSALEQQRDRR